MPQKSKFRVICEPQEDRRRLRFKLGSGGRIKCKKNKRCNDFFGSGGYFASASGKARSDLDESWFEKSIGDRL